MPIFRTLFLLFLTIPLIEIYLLIQVGEVIGALPTIFMVVFTAVLGVALLRWQGLVTLTRMQASMARGELPAIAMIEGVFLLVAGALLLTPGFFTDGIGFALLIPPIRRFLAQNLLMRGMFRTGAGFSAGKTYEDPFGKTQSGQTGGPKVIEGEYERRDD